MNFLEICFQKFFLRFTSFKIHKLETERIQIGKQLKEDTIRECGMLMFRYFLQINNRVLMYLTWDIFICTKPVDMKK